MRLKLPPKVKYIIELLEMQGFEAYAVGGCVRDTVLMRTPQDWDITTSARPEQIKEVFHRTVDTGIQHGTVTVLVGDEGFEVTTYRIDGEYLDGRHPKEVIFTPSLEEDLLRRDFTINAMAYNDRTGLVDLYGGMNDLQRKRIRCVGKADDRFDEDALRILRAVRFSAQLGFQMDDETRESVAAHAENLRKISAERIQAEILKLISSPHPEKWLDLYELGITAVIMPEFDVCMETPQNTPYHFYNVGEHTVRAMCAIRADKDLRLAVLFHDLAKPVVRFSDSTGRDHFAGHAPKGAGIAEEIMRRLKMDNRTIRKVSSLVRTHELRPDPDPSLVRKTIHLVTPELFPDYLEIQRADNAAKSRYGQLDTEVRVDPVEACYREIISRGDPLTLKELVIGGRDLTELGISGKAVGDILKECLMEVLEDPAANSRERLLSFAKMLKEQ
ncbi:MAG: HD domain-containing protein [Lachnospiraceae bacterium]|nr:HD domain-containing protein [Lachnospiraceae bacterium]